MPPKAFVKVWKHFLLSQLREWFWHLVNRGQRCCLTCLLLRATPPTKKELSSPKCQYCRGPYNSSINLKLFKIKSFKYISKSIHFSAIRYNYLSTGLLREPPNWPSFLLSLFTTLHHLQHGGRSEVVKHKSDHDIPLLKTL